MKYKEKIGDNTKSFLYALGVLTIVDYGVLHVMEKITKAFIATWGLWQGLLVAPLITWLLSVLFWDSFRIDVLADMTIPCVMAGAYLQYSVEMSD